MAARKPGPERELQTRGENALRLHGYVGMHVFRMQLADGSWRTGTPPGWPDGTYLRPPRQLTIEWKGPTGRLTPQQVAWLSMSAAVPCHRTWVIAPGKPDFDVFLTWIERPARAPDVYGFEPIDLVEARRIIEQARSPKRAKVSK